MLVRWVHGGMLVLLTLIGGGCHAGSRGGGEQTGNVEAGRLSQAPARETKERLPSGEPVQVVVYFPSWEYIAITKPKVAEGAFLHFMKRAEAERVLSSLRVPRGTVAVVCDFPKGAEQNLRDQNEWVEVLKGQGFKRVVFVRKNPDEPLALARVLREVPLTRQVPKRSQ